MDGHETLKIILSVLCCIVFLAIAIVLLVLFMPLNYSVRAKGQDKDIQCKGTVTWLFGIIRAAAFYSDGDLSYRITCLGLLIKSGKPGEKKKKEESNRRKSFKFRKKNKNEYRTEPEPLNSEPQVSRETVLAMLEQQKEKEEGKKNGLNLLTEKKAENRNKTKKNPTSPKKPFKEKIKDIWLKIQKFVNKANDYKNKASKIKRALDTKTGQRAIQYVKFRLLKLFNSIKPNCIKGFVKYGTGDPAKTAEIYGIAAQVSYVITDDRLMVEPDFENELIDLDVTVKGKVYIISIVIFIISIITRSDVSRIWKEIRRITKNG